MEKEKAIELLNSLI